ncbi:MAG: OmpA family protein [Flavisolibacter sp.]|jgi:outer membrane protein OmpA-like peptidoglycan-associated protein|nr:OmpA family protein [Flavisolibacter sp.]
MAEIEVQPKKQSSTSFLPWLLLALGVIALVYFLTRNGDNEEAATAATTDTTTYSSTSDNAARSGWDGVDYDNAPSASYSEVRNNNIDVRGTDNYAIYRIKENDLFDNDQATLKADAQESLREIAQSINTRFSNGQVRVYSGNAQADNASSQHSQQRAEAIKSWLNQNGLSTNITTHSISERNSTGGNNNNLLGNDNRIEIVAMRAQ